MLLVWREGCVFIPETARPEQLQDNTRLAQGKHLIRSVLLPFLTTTANTAWCGHVQKL
jgi:hypothetical protein